MILRYISVIQLCALLFSAPVFALQAEAEKNSVESAPLQQSSASGAESPLDKEIRAMKEQIASTPAESLPRIQLGYLLLKKGSPAEARLYFAEALKISPRSHSALTGEGAVLSAQGNLKEAEQTLKAALQQNPNPVRTHYELGVVYQKLGDLDKALQEYKEGISKHQQGRK